MNKVFCKSVVAGMLSATLIFCLTSCGKSATSSSDVVQNNSASDSVKENESQNQVTSTDNKYSEKNENIIATVNGENISKSDIGYYIYNNAVIQIYKVDSNTAEDVTSFDWSQTNANGEILKDVVIDNAINDAVNDVVFRQMAEKQGYSIDKAKNEASDLVSESLNKKGESDFIIGANLMGISDAETYRKIYTNVSIFEDVSKDFYNDPSKYVDDINVLSDYIGTKGATVQHILIMNDTTKGEAKVVAQEVLTKARNGEDFLELMKQYNEDTGEEDLGYTFPEGEMVPSFENAAFALKIGEISDVVQSDYGFHIIKRNAGAYELQNYWRALSDVSIVDNAKYIADFDGVIEMIKNANSNKKQKGN